MTIGPGADEEDRLQVSPLRHPPVPAVSARSVRRGRPAGGAPQFGRIPDKVGDVVRCGPVRDPAPGRPELRSARRACGTARQPTPPHPATRCRSRPARPSASRSDVGLHDIAHVEQVAHRVEVPGPHPARTRGPGFPQPRGERREDEPAILPRPGVGERSGDDHRQARCGATPPAPATSRAHLARGVGDCRCDGVGLPSRGRPGQGRTPRRWRPPRRRPSTPAFSRCRTSASASRAVPAAFTAQASPGSARASRIGGDRREVHHRVRTELAPPPGPSGHR